MARVGADLPTAGVLVRKPTSDDPSAADDIDAEEATLVRSEEELRVGVIPTEAGWVRARKGRPPASGGGRPPGGRARGGRALGARRARLGEVEMLPDGSLSIPVFEEQLVVQKRLVVRERIVIRKHTVTQEQVVQADLRRERVELEADAGVQDRISEADSGDFPGP